MNKSEALEACPWCKGKLEAGILQGDRLGVSWFDEDSIILQPVLVLHWGETGPCFHSPEMQGM